LATYEQGTKMLKFDLSETGRPMSFSNRQEPFQFRATEKNEPEDLPLVGDMPDLDISDLSLWADDRLSIYASLDTAMTKTIVEAVQSLTELKRKIEEDALTRTLRIATERDVMRREVSDLEDQKRQLQEEIAAVRRQLDEEQNKKQTLAKEYDGLVVETRFARERLAEQTAAFTAQLSQMQEAFRQVLQEAIQKGGQSFSFSAPSPDILPTKPMPIITGSNEPTPNQVVVRDKMAEDKKVVPEISAARLIEFTEASTPLYMPGIGSSVNGLNGAHNNGFARMVETTPPSQVQVKPDKPKNIDLMNEVFQENPTEDVMEENTARPQRRNNQAEQRVTQFLRRRQTGELQGSKVGGQRSENADQGLEARNEPDNESFVSEEDTFLAQPQNKEKAKLSEIGLMLGLDADTPPDLKAMRFADGYTPPPMPVIKDTKRPKTIEEIFNAPSTPEPALIGEIGPDVALQWRDALNEQAKANDASKRRILGDYPLYPTKPPPSGSTPAGDEATVTTAVKIGNLNGLSLLMMERVVRTLPGVHHVTVTEFDRDQLALEVTHSANIELEKVITSQPQLNKLRVVKSTPGVLEFVQDSTKIL
jgi:hypothetical protein